VTSAEYLSGALALGVLLGGAAVSASVLLARHRPSDLIGAPAAAAWLLIAAAFVFCAHLVPGVLGGLSTGTVTVTAVMLTAIALSIPGRLRRPKVEAAPAGPPEPRWSVLLGLGAAVAVAAYLIGWALDNGGIYLGQQDVVSFHLPNVARWIQEGSLWGIHDWIPSRAPGNYPQTGDVYLLAALLPWERDFAAPFVAYPFFALAGLAMYAAGRELGAPAGLSMLGASAVIAMPAVAYIGVSALADLEMIALFAAGGLFLLRHWRTGDRFDLVLAGLGLGLAFGARWYGVPAVGAVLLVWGVARWRHGGGGLAREGAVLGGLIVLSGGFWLLRNWIESGNPVFPVEIAPLGVSLFDAPRDLFREEYGFTLSHYLTDFDAIREYIWPSFLRFLTFTSLALWAGVVGCAVFALRRRARERAAAARARGRGQTSSPRGRRRGPVESTGAPVALAATAGLIMVAYMVTPYSGWGTEGVPAEAWVNARYVLPALVVAAPALAWLLSCSDRLPRVGSELPT
jgi:hypothetical protein